jgi:hypothetical protein
MPDDGHDHHTVAVQAPSAGPGVGFADEEGRSRTESLGERVLGSLLDRAHLMLARLVGPLVAHLAAGLRPANPAATPRPCEFARAAPCRS